MITSQKIFNLILLDESGSMSTIKESVLSGFKETVQSIRHSAATYPEQEHFITLVTFNGAGIKTLLSNQPVESLQQLNDTLYSPDYNTPLFDAMGFALTRLQTQLELVPNHYVLVTIYTDGLENASTKWTRAQIKSLVESLRAKGWTLAYIGANHDVTNFAQEISIPNALCFNADAAGVQQAFKRDNYSRSERVRRIKQGLPLMDDYFEPEK